MRKSSSLMRMLAQAILRPNYSSHIRGMMGSHPLKQGYTKEVRKFPDFQTGRWVVLCGPCRTITNVIGVGHRLAPLGALFGCIWLQFARTILVDYKTIDK